MTLKEVSLTTNVSIDCVQGQQLTVKHENLNKIKNPENLIHDPNSKYQKIILIQDQYYLLSYENNILTRRNFLRSVLVRAEKKIFQQKKKINYILKAKGKFGKPLKTFILFHRLLKVQTKIF